MTLHELRAAYPHLFLAQTWFLGEAFMETPLPADAPTVLPHVIACDAVGALLPASLCPCCGTRLIMRSPVVPLAVTLAALYVASPGDALWERYLWCWDMDGRGQRIYVGGVSADNDHRFEIHRHLAITERWGIPVW